LYTNIAFLIIIFFCYISTTFLGSYSLNKWSLFSCYFKIESLKLHSVDICIHTNRQWALLRNELGYIWGYLRLSSKISQLTGDIWNSSFDSSSVLFPSVKHCCPRMLCYTYVCDKSGLRFISHTIHSEKWSIGIPDVPAFTFYVTLERRPPYLGSMLVRLWNHVVINANFWCAPHT
jgi:hypothetical protein